MAKKEHHRLHRVGWLRAAVLGANDGVVSTSSLIIGVASAGAAYNSILLSGLAGIVAGAISMAAGEYVSVCSQEDTEKADLLKEQESIADDYELEVLELAEIYEERGVEKTVAMEVARQLMEKDALGAHARDDIGISESTKARPIQAAVSSAASFLVGAVLPLAVVMISPMQFLIPLVAIFSLIFLAVLGGVSAKLGGAKVITGIMRVSFWGILAMVVTAGVGLLFDIVV